MTTKYKIITGFVVMIVLMGVVAVLGYMNLGTSSDAFGAYRRFARMNTDSSDIQATINVASGRTFAYLSSRNQKDMDTALENSKLAGKLIDEAKAKTNVPGFMASLDGIAALGQRFTGQQALIDSEVTALTDMYTKNVVPNAQAFADNLDQLIQGTAQSGNSAALATAANIWGAYGRGLAVMYRFSQSYNPADATRIAEYFKPLPGLIDTLSTQVQAAANKKQARVLTESYENMSKAFLNMREHALRLAKAVEQFDKERTDTVAAVAKFSSEVDADAVKLADNTISDNNQAQYMLMVIGLIAMLAGVALAAYSIIGIVRVLGDLSNFAGAVAKGDFTYQVRTKEKGEIGNMVDAMRQIPDVLENVIKTATDLSIRIRGGRLRDRVNTSDFHGSYGTLANSLNAMGDAFTQIIDSLPLPVLTGDKQNAVLFANQEAQNSVGGNLAESLEPLNGGTAAIFGKHAMDNGDEYSKETVVTVHGKRMDLAVTAVPLKGAQGESVAFMEVLTDLTEIKAQQNLMMDVANQASEISNRVAAASEELAAQVEQVSRGAEMQRERVESTAGAMTEMNATVLEVARSAGQASEQSEGTRQKAEDGATLVGKVISSINTVNTISHNLSNNMQELGKQAESIGAVMNVISDIADQTNLLALNAAIEAARAGEAGRGFAVVADEVRKLAEKTMEATQEVGSSINAVQQSARINIDEVARAASSVTEATDLANSSGEALAEIVNLASASSSVVTSIATAAEEQSATSEEISRAIDEINHIVGETTEGMVQSSAAVQDLSRMAQELRRVMEGLR